MAARHNKALSVPEYMTDVAERYKEAVDLLNSGNPEKALPLFEALAAEGHVDSMLHVANCYTSGVGAERDLSLAISYLKEAADAGSEIAPQLLALVEKLQSIEADSSSWQSYGG